ncbi:MAG: CotH kinase family protein [Bacteroidaceae bacterium]|nr:CotH kinase family protein [Bacteroidaceae bacterium]
MLRVNAQNIDANSLPLRFTEVCVANIDQIVDYSNNYGSWVEVYNPTTISVSLEDYFISDDAANLRKHKLEGYGKLNPGCYKCIFFDHHASDGEYGVDASKQVRFKLNRDGGQLYLTSNTTNATISLIYPPAIARCSFALMGIDNDAWEYCGKPTPGVANEGYYAQECLDLPDVDCDSKLFTNSFTVNVPIPNNATLRYTLDGSTPTLSNGKTSTNGSFRISQNTVLRLRLFADGYLPSGVVTRTYIYKDRDYYLPIVAVSTDPCNLYDDYIGCYVNGKNGIKGRGSSDKSNLNMDWVRPVNFEYLTADGKMVINQETSFEVIGGYSRHFEPASFKVQAKKLYDGNGTFGYPVFAGKPYCKYKQLLIRNGGNNNRTNGGPRIKDAITQQVLTTSDYYVDAQDYQPAHVFINGKYLAMMNVREPNNRFHGNANYGYDDDKVDGFEYSNGIYRQRGGCRDEFDRLIALSENAETDAGYDEICKLLDMDEFIHYMAACCYTGSYDWLVNGNNVKGYRAWRDGKFHFVFFDQDLTWERTNNVETIDGVTKNEILLLYNNLKRNKTFCKQFVTSYCILHGSIYTPERCEYVADSICNLVKNALSFDRRYTSGTYNKMREDMWGQNNRKARIHSLMNAYQLPDSIKVVINTNNVMASIHLDGQRLPFNQFSGSLFGTERISVESAEGYDFIGWRNQQGKWVCVCSDFNISKPGTYTAVYNLSFNEEFSPMCINEVSAANDVFINDYGKRSDWIELYNRGKEPIDVTKLYFLDNDNPTRHQIDAAPDVNTIVQPNGHIVVWCDDKPSLTQLHLPFKIKNDDGGYLSLISDGGRWTDVIRYNTHSGFESVGRYPDGGATCYTFYHPTIERHNVKTMYDNNVKSITSSIGALPMSNDIVSIAYYTIDGKKATPENGIYIKVVGYKDGHVDSSKVLIRNGISIIDAR